MSMAEVLQNEQVVPVTPVPSGNGAAIAKTYEENFYKEKENELLAACRKNLKNFDEAMIKKALKLCYDAHKSDRRASGEPYFIHPFEVAMIVATEVPLDDVSIACALLHDVVEDTAYGIDEIREEFGTEVADIVDGATKISDIFKSKEITQAESYRKMLISMVSDVRVMLVKFADRLHNMRTIEYISAERQMRMAKETLDVYAPFAHRFGLAKIKWELEDLSFKVLNRQAYDSIKKSLVETRIDRENYISKFIDPIKHSLDAEKMKYEVIGRPKHIFSIYNKTLKQGTRVEDLYDLFAIRIILDTPNDNDCFSVYGIISSIYTPVPERFKNYISVPKKNGYQSIHTTVIGPGGKMVEVQIRTKKMHEIAEKGLAAHWKYKEQVAKTDPEIEDWVNWVREVFDQHGEDAPKALMESFRLNLYQDEIYVFTPKGDLRILPKGATIVDFAFEIHTQVGMHTIGAKLNGKIVPLHTKLPSGAQVEIITSKNQTPNPDWEQFVVTHKARKHIRNFLNEEQRLQISSGKEQFAKRMAKAKLHVNEDTLMKFISATPMGNLGKFYWAIAEQKVDSDEYLQKLREFLKPGSEKKEEAAPVADSMAPYLREARKQTGILIQGKRDDLLYSYAKCCNPVPGDDVVGIVTIGEGVKIHRTQCNNIKKMQSDNKTERLIDVEWPSTEDGAEFLVGIQIMGEDRQGMISDLTHVISSYNNTNIRSFTIDTRDQMFDGKITVYVKNTYHLTRILEKIRRVRGVTNAVRYEE
jgi:guanosine-3',5'-bis(diphosphate) 3'-pyrophosphohydrolase